MFHRKVKGVDYTSIHERYQDTALVIYKKQQQELRERSGKRASRKRSLRLAGSKVTNPGESSNDSAPRVNDVSAVPAVAVLSTAQTKNNFTSGGSDGVMPNEDDEGLEGNRLGVQSKVCSVL